jgi:hypothetical protein
MEMRAARILRREIFCIGFYPEKAHGTRHFRVARDLFRNGSGSLRPEGVDSGRTLAQTISGIEIVASFFRDAMNAMNIL